MSSIGTTWEKRDISLVEIDARAMATKNLKSMGAVVKKVKNKQQGAENVEMEEDVKVVEETMKEEDSKQEGSKKEEKKEEEEDATLLELGTDAEPSSPGILITGAHHARELITVQQVYYLISKLLQGGVLGSDPEVTK